MELERLFPDPATAPVETLLDAVRAPSSANPDRPAVLLNMVATVDGRAAVGGRSGPIGGEGDSALFGELRTLTDAILVGTGTLRAEGYGRLVRSEARRARREAAGLPADPSLLLLSRRLDLPWDAPLFAVPEQRVLVGCADDAEGGPPAQTRAQVELVRLGEEPDLAGLLRVARREHGVRSVLCEGGPTLNARLLAAGMLDELFLTIGPLLTGDDQALGILGGPALPEPARLALRWVLRHEDELYLRYAVAAPTQP